VKQAMYRVSLLTGMLCVVSDLRAQGAISLQGFGYPPGQLTVRASSTGGALNEFDQASPTNPAALMNWGVAGAYVQYSPERRSTSAGGSKVATTVPRFPVISIGLPAGSRYAFGLSSSTLLERNFTTTTTARQQVRTDSVTTTSVATARGGINEIRFGGAMQVRRWLRVGTGLHVVTGENRVGIVRSIVPDTGARRDTVSYATISDQSTATFSGTAVSVGVEVLPLKNLSVAGSARLGFRMGAELNDSTKRHGDVPDRAGIAVRWEVGGTNLAARYDWQGWSSMAGLGAASSGVFDTREFGLGAELPGPRIRGGQVLFRLGARNRNLPFGVGGRQPTESVFGGGLGFPLAFGRAQLDVGLDRAQRKVPGLPNVKESGLTMSFGFRLRT
jgi:hypothetical protein